MSALIYPHMVPPLHFHSHIHSVNCFLRYSNVNQLHSRSQLAASLYPWPCSVTLQILPSRGKSISLIPYSVESDLALWLALANRMWHRWPYVTCECGPQGVIHASAFSLETIPPCHWHVNKSGSHWELGINKLIFWGVGRDTIQSIGLSKEVVLFNL